MVRHVVVALLLVVLVFGSGIDYNVAQERHWPYPDYDEPDDHYERYVGEDMLLFGTVETIDRDDDCRRYRS
jgi:hypothetical protein